MLAPPPTFAAARQGAADAACSRARGCCNAPSRGRTPDALLRGKNLGLVCDSEDGADALLFREAAAALGASVSHIRPELAPPGGADRQRTCFAPRACSAASTTASSARGSRRRSSASSVARPACRCSTGSPTAAHPTARLAQELTGVDPLETKRQLIVQAVLLLELR